MFFLSQMDCFVRVVDKFTMRRVGNLRESSIRNRLWIVWSTNCSDNHGNSMSSLHQTYTEIFSRTSIFYRGNDRDGAAALVGSLGLIPSLNLSPTLVIGEPVHGSAPDIQGKGIANPIAAIRSAGMMIAQLGWVEEGKKIEEAVRGTLEAGILTPDLGGKNTTDDVTYAVLERIR